METDFDIVIIGAGLVGLTTALACVDSGARVALLDRKSVTAGADGRASALSTTSLHIFDNLGVDLKGFTQPIRDMLVTDGEPSSPWRLHFESDEDTSEGHGDLGALIENVHLKTALIDTVKITKDLTLFAPIDVHEVTRSVKGVEITTDQGLLTARLLIAADGRESGLRRKAGITVQRYDYAAASLVTTIAHDLPHDGLAWQRMIPGGALAVLPLPKTSQHSHRSQIVWSGPTASIQAAAEVSDEDFLALLFEKMNGYLGSMTLEASRQSYPLRLQIADGFTDVRLALVGDAAHVIHPLAGQGLNLGLRDAAAIAEGIKIARETGQDIGVASLLDYDLWRNSDTRALGLLTHMMAETTRLKGGVFSHSRRLGLALTNRSATLKGVFKSRASGEAQDLPDLMRRR